MAGLIVGGLGGDRKRYTRKDDEKIVKLANEGTSVADIALAVDRTEASVQYRIYRVLKKVASFDEIKYK